MSTGEPSSILRASRREALFVMGMWIASSAWTVGYCRLFAYGKELPRLVYGIPEWVVWGIFAPWTVCTLVTCWFAIFGIRDQDLGEEVESVAHG